MPALKYLALMGAVGLGGFGVRAAEPGELLREWFAGFAPVPGAEIRMHRFETTQDIYRLVAGTEPSRWAGERNSVEMVSWDDAVAFCGKATRRLREAGLITDAEEVRLPGEQEWEHAARAGTTTAYSFGDDAGRLGDYGWFTGNAAGNDPPAGTKQPNPWGFFDFHGYVWEWCADAAGEKRVVRGGAWTSTAAECRSDSRKEVGRETRAPDVGFRCVLASVRR
jgi:formylglycine-generating enzyme required for sulfatase activity